MYFEHLPPLIAMHRLFPDEITASFRRFGHLFVDWPHKAESKSYFPPKGELAAGIPSKPIFSSFRCSCPTPPPEGRMHMTRRLSFLPGYAFLLFQDESSVQALIDACIEEDGKLYLCVSSPTIKDKPVSVPCPPPLSLCQVLSVTKLLFGGGCVSV